MMRSQTTNFWNVAAKSFLGSTAAGIGDVGFLVASRRPRLGRLRLFDRGPLRCSSAACHRRCCRLGVLLCSGSRRFPDLKVATYRGGRTLLPANSFSLRCPPAGGWVVI